MVAQRVVGNTVIDEDDTDDAIRPMTTATTAVMTPTMTGEVARGKVAGNIAMASTDVEGAVTRGVVPAVKVPSPTVIQISIPTSGFGDVHAGNSEAGNAADVGTVHAVIPGNLSPRSVPLPRGGDQTGLTVLSSMARWVAVVGNIAPAYSAPCDCLPIVMTPLLHQKNDSNAKFTSFSSSVITNPT